MKKLSVIASSIQLAILMMLYDSVLIRAQIQQEDESNLYYFPNECQSISVFLVHHYLLQHLLDISHDTEFSLTNRSRTPTKLFNRSSRTFKNIFIERCALALCPCIENYEFFQVYWCWSLPCMDIIDFFVEVIIPFVDVNFRGMPIFYILIYIFDIFHFKGLAVYRIFSLMKSFWILPLIYYSVMLLCLLSIRG